MIGMLCNQIFPGPAGVSKHRHFKVEMRTLIAEAMSCEIEQDDHTWVRAVQDPVEDIEIFTIPVGNQPGDHSPAAILIDIEAFDYPKRVETKDTQAEIIRQGAVGELARLGLEGNPKVTVWIKLMPAGFA